MKRDEILAGVRDCLAAALEVEPEELRPEARLVADLGADSLDLLDLVFRLETRFRVPINPRQIERRAREALGGRPLEVDGVYTPEALAVLRAALPEVPAEELGPGLTAAELPRRFRVATMVNLVERFLEEQTPDGGTDRKG